MGFGAIGSSVLDLLKLLTPTEIKRLTEFNVGQKGLTKKKLKISSQNNDYALSSSDIGPHSAELGTTTDHSNVLPFTKKHGGGSFDGEKQELSLEQDDGAGHSLKPGVEAKSELVQGDLISAPVSVGPAVEVESLNSAELALSKTEQMLEKAGVLSAQKVEYLKRQQLEKEKKGQVSASIFLLQEREKLSGIVNQMKKIEILKAYQEESKVDVELEKFSNAQDLSTNPGSGVLVNKKHY